MDESLSIVAASLGLTDVTSAVIGVGVTGITLAAIVWGTPYLTRFFIKISRD